VLVTCGGDELSEAVACLSGVQPSLPPSADSEHAGIRYQFRSRVRRPRSHGTFRVAVRLVALRAALSRHRLLGRFPGAPGALTALVARGRAGGASWTTWHTYPQTREIVITRSRVRWA
jgi:hypothetical protein